MGVIGTFDFDDSGRPFIIRLGNGTRRALKYELTLDEGDPLLRDVLKWASRGPKSIVSIQPSGSIECSRSSSSGDNNEIVSSETTGADDVTSPETSLDVTGTPLECPFDLNDRTMSDDCNEAIQRDCSLPESNSRLTIGEAGTLLNAVCVYLLRQREEDDIDLKSVPFVAVCDGNDSNGTLYLGYQKVDDRLVRFRVTCSETALTIAELTKLDEMIRRHSLEFPQRVVVETEAKAIYCILQRANNDWELKNQSNIELNCVWNGVKEVLEVPDEDAVCNITFDVSLGDIRSSAHDKFQELILLEDLASGLRTGEITWTTVRTDSSVESSVIQLLEGMKMSGGKVKREYDRKTRDSNFMTFDMNMQRNLDFTDKLWMVLKGCQSLTELARSMAVVLETVQLGEIKPVMFGSNRTSFLKIVSDVIRSKAPVLTLTGIEPLHMLVEMGIEKLRQDYTYILLNSGLVTKDSLVHFFTSKAPNDWQIDLISLRKLHCTIELVALCQTFVDPSHVVLGDFTRCALDRLRLVKSVDRLVSFKFGVEKKTMKSISERFTPLMWQVSLTSRQDSYFAQTVYRMTNDHPFYSTNANRPRTRVEDCSDSKVASYYVCVATLVQDSM